MSEREKARRGVRRWWRGLRGKGKGGPTADPDHRSGGLYGGGGHGTTIGGVGGMPGGGRHQG